ncbi:D-lyxose/D-mannose family sugar isomerase [Mesorhizobium sp. M0701]|uniref:D-lyxose/D-mannose family sugar isomerase n=1 Tax=Mesorhizobium sp. M0701 TaxID=2956989 RepID=UPI00333A3236
MAKESLLAGLISVEPRLSRSFLATSACDCQRIGNTSTLGRIGISTRVTEFAGEDGTGQASIFGGNGLLIGEIAIVNDHATDNVFREPIGRFGEGGI